MDVSSFTALILAGGFGTRLGNDSQEHPKPMTIIGEQPILVHIIMSYAKFGVKNFIILGGYKSDFIKQYFSVNGCLEFNDGKDSSGYKFVTQFGELTVIVKDTGLNTMTGGRLRYIKGDLLVSDDFFLTYGDGLCDIDFRDQMKFHQAHGEIATLTAVTPPSRFAKLKLDKTTVLSFREKFDSENTRISGGFFVFNSKVLDYIPNNETVLEEGPLERLALEGELRAYVHDGFWQCLDTPRDLKYLQQISQTQPYPWMHI
jgi:glucose-1-phosphate cytidylyltransferase